MKGLEFKDFLIVCAFGFNIGTIISSYILNISFWLTLFVSTGLLGLAVILIMGEEE